MTARWSIANISPNFLWTEAKCRDGTEVPLELQQNAIWLAESVLEPIRATFGGPLVIVSWYRTPEHNAKVGGARNSRHLRAQAADIRPKKAAELPMLKAVIENMIALGKLPALGGYGRYEKFVHVDSRPRKRNGALYRWEGKGGE